MKARRAWEYMCMLLSVIGQLRGGHDCIGRPGEDDGGKPSRASAAEKQLRRATQRSGQCVAINRHYCQPLLSHLSRTTSIPTPIFCFGSSTYIRNILPQLQFRYSSHPSPTIIHPLPAAKGSEAQWLKIQVSLSTSYL